MRIQILLLLVSLCTLLTPQNVYSQSVLSKFKELNELFNQTEKKPQFTIDETGNVMIREKKGDLWKFHFTDIQKGDSLWKSDTLCLVVMLKEGKKMRHMGTQAKIETIGKYQIPFEDPDLARKAIKKFKEAVEIGKPRTRIF